MNDYQIVLGHARSYYENSKAKERTITAHNDLRMFFDSASKMNPSVARMSLQQGQNDAYAGLAIDLAEGKITPEEFKTKKVNMINASFAVNHDSKLSELENRIKIMYPKTAKKRLSIIPGLQDGEYLGLSNVKDGKWLKKFQYILRRILTK